MLFPKGRQRGGRLLAIAEHCLERGSSGKQAGAAGIFRVELGDVIEARDALIAVDHSLKLVQFVDQIGAAEFDFLTGAAGARGIRIDGHRQGIPFCVHWESGRVKSSRVERTILPFAARKRNPARGCWQRLSGANGRSCRL
jgi:hypothetical protein